MISKEDILNKRSLIFYGRVPAEDQVDGEKEKVLEAMDEYAKEIAIGFIKYSQISTIKDANELGQWFVETNGEYEYLTDEQLFQSYLNTLIQ